MDLDGHTCVGMLEYMEGVVLTSHVCTLVQDDHVHTHLCTVIKETLLLDLNGTTGIFIYFISKACMH